MRNKIQLIENDSELGAGTRGASMGIGALKCAAYNAGINLFNRYETSVVKTYNQALWEKDETPFAKRIKHIENVFKNTCEEVSKSIDNNNLPVVISGDHSSAGGTIAGIKKAYPSKTLGVVWIDAHADLHTPYTTPSGNVHGMPLATALQLDNLDQKCNEPNKMAISSWEALKALGHSSKLVPENLAFCAVRDTELPEDFIMESLKITNHKVADIRVNGAKATGISILKQLENCDIIYVSFDVDSMDCDLVSCGTGTPVKDGLTPKESKDLMEVLLASPKLCCFEMVEINPCLDEKTNTMAETSVQILEHALTVIEG